jgi:predicted aspartyl protease
MPTTDCGYANNQFGRKLLIHYGPELGVLIGFDPDYKQDSRAAPKLKGSSFAALVDTGARESCIDSKLANELGLPVFDRRPVAGASGIREVDFHLAQIHVPKLKFTIMGRLAGLPLTESGFRQRAILGRSFLSYLRLNYDGPTGDVSLAID